MHTTGLDLFFTAKSVAVIGASTNKQKVGYQILNNLIKAERNESRSAKKRAIYPINPTSHSILGLKTHQSISQITDEIDMVVIVTPVGTVLSLVNEIIERNRLLAQTKRVKSVIIISAGFAEIDKEGRELQNLVTTKLLLANIRLLGPNTLGLIHTGYALNASFAQLDIPEGNLAVISQSGAMLTSLFNALHSRQAGVSFAISLGNKADINENDCLQYALQDTQTAAVIMYIESFSHLPTFFELVSQLRRVKPVIVLKGGTSSRGQVASSSHTAALATNQALLQSASAQFGFTLVENMEELMNVAFYLAHHKHLPTNTMVITNAGGPAVNTVDELQKTQVPLARWSRSAAENLEHLLPKSKAANPMDLLGDADPQRFKSAIEVAQRDPDIDSITIIITPQAVTDVPGIVEQILAIRGKKPLFVALMGGDHLETQRQKLRQRHIICSPFANDIVDMLSVLNRAAKHAFLPYRYVLSRPHTPTSLSDRLEGPQLRQTMIKQHGLPEHLILQPNLRATFSLLKKNHFRLPKYWIISRAEFSELKDLPYPLFVKTANLSIIHKKSVGAVFGIVNNANEAKQAYYSMSKFGNDVLYQELLDIDHELLVGIENDPQFGLYLTVGLGGSYTNLLADRAYCFLPAPRSVIQRAWKETKAAQVFADNEELTEGIIDELDRLQKLIMQYPWIRAIEVNPFAVSRDKLWVADIKLQV
jgi:acyl-CoA synthetase (NDP forming)